MNQKNKKKQKKGKSADGGAGGGKEKTGFEHDAGIVRPGEGKGSRDRGGDGGFKEKKKAAPGKAAKQSSKGFKSKKRYKRK